VLEPKENGVSDEQQGNMTFVLDVVRCLTALDVVVPRCVLTSCLESPCSLNAGRHTALSPAKNNVLCQDLLQYLME
jgi:hypothetical protein